MFKTGPNYTQNFPYFRSQSGFTLIELTIIMVVIVIISVVSLNSYIGYRDRATLESAARSVRDFIRQAQDNAKNGQFSSKIFTDAEVDTEGAYWGNKCYLIYDENKNFCGESQATQRAVGEEGTNNETDGSYSSCIEMVASEGIVLESWIIRGQGKDLTTNSDGNIIEMLVDCRYRRNPLTNPDGPIYTYTFASDGRGNFDSNSGYYRKNFNYKTLVEQQLKLPEGVSIVQNFYFEFQPYYLNIQFPLTTINESTGEKIPNIYYDATNQYATDLNSGPYGAQINEIVLSLNDDQYLYKIPILNSGSTGEGCFCSNVPGEECKYCREDLESTD